MGRLRLPAAQGGLDAILFFDGVPVYGARQGVFSLLLETLVQDVEGEAPANHRVVGHLRTAAEGIRSLKAAIEKLEVMAATPAGGRN